MPYKILGCSSCDDGVPTNHYGHVSADGNAVWACTKDLRMRETLAEIAERHRLPHGFLEDLAAWAAEEREEIKSRLIEDLIGHVQDFGAIL